MSTSDTRRWPVSDAQAAADLEMALAMVRDVSAMISDALKRVDAADANAIHAAELKAQRQRFETLGKREGERLIVRSHPLFALWKLALQACAQLEQLISLLNPSMHVQRVSAMQAARQLVSAGRIALKADTAAA